MLKGLVLVCEHDFHCNKPLEQVRMMLQGCTRILEIRISNSTPNHDPETLLEKI